MWYLVYSESQVSIRLCLYIMPAATDINFAIIYFWQGRYDRLYSRYIGTRRYAQTHRHTEQ